MLIVTDSMAQISSCRFSVTEELLEVRTNSRINYFDDEVSQASGTARTCPA